MSLVVGTNSYITVAEADTLLADHPDAAIWTALTTAQKGTWLIHACKQLETLSYRGSKVETTQYLAFPRNFDTISNYTPNNVKIAQAIQALWLSQNYDRQKERLDLDDLNIKDYGVGDVTEVRYKITTLLCAEARAYVYLYIHNYNNFAEVSRT